jgi:hypothetical protein
VLHDPEPKAHEAMGYESKEHDAMDYIQKSRGAPIEIEVRRPSTSSRHFSPFESRHTLSQPLTPVENGRRSGRPRESRKNSSPIRKDRMTEIVEPPPRKLSVPTGSSDPRGVKHTMNSLRKESLRAATMETVREDRHAPLRRAESMPVQSPRRSEHIAAQSSRLRTTEINDSDHSSSEWYQATSPPLKSRRYHISEDDENSGKRTYFHVKHVDDSHRERDRDRERDRERERDRDRERERDISPRTRRPSDRTSTGSRPPSNARIPQRSMSYVAAYPVEPLQSPRPPPLSRAETARAPPPQTRQSIRPLYGEVSPSEAYKVVHQLPKIRRDDIRYSPHSPREPIRDAYPYESSRNRPAMQRSETRAVY